MVKAKYVPRRGDIVWLAFDPTRGHEQRGKRPAFVVSPTLYNQKSSLALVCPISSQSKGYPFEVEIAGSHIRGVVLADHLRSIDWRARKAKYVESVAQEVVTEIQDKINQLIIG